MITQPDPQDSKDLAVMEAGMRGHLAAVAGDEELIFPEMRKWHSSRVNYCRPYWLYGFSEENVGGKLDEALQWYSTVTKRTVCKFPVDRVRAMYPMFFNTPCENQTELYGLIDDVTDATSKLPAIELESFRNGTLRPIKIQKASTWASLQGGTNRVGDSRRSSTWQGKTKLHGTPRMFRNSTRLTAQLSELAADDSMRPSAGYSSLPSLPRADVSGTLPIGNSEFSHVAKDLGPALVTPLTPTETAVAELPEEEETSNTTSDNYQKKLARPRTTTDKELLRSSQNFDLLLADVARFERKSSVKLEELQGNQNLQHRNGEASGQQDSMESPNMLHSGTSIMSSGASGSLNVADDMRILQRSNTFDSLMSNRQQGSSASYDIRGSSASYDVKENKRLSQLSAIDDDDTMVEDADE